MLSLGGPLKRLLPAILADIGVPRVLLVLGVLVVLALGVLVLVSCASMETLTSGSVCVLLREFIETEGDVARCRDAQPFLIARSPRQISETNISMTLKVLFCPIGSDYL